MDGILGYPWTTKNFENNNCDPAKNIYLFHFYKTNSPQSPERMIGGDHHDDRVPHDRRRHCKPGKEKKIVNEIYLSLDGVSYTHERFCWQRILFNTMEKIDKRTSWSIVFTLQPTGILVIMLFVNFV